VTAIGSPSPITLGPDEGEVLWFLDFLTTVKASGEETDGGLTVMEQIAPFGAGSPLHVHRREDEAFWILEGDVTFEVGDAVIEARAGDYAFGPRDVPHRYRVGEAGCRMLFICAPGGFEGLVREMSRPAESRTLPPPMTEPPDMARIAAIAEAHGCELLG